MSDIQPQNTRQQHTSIVLRILRSPLYIPHIYAIAMASVAYEHIGCLRTAKCFALVALGLSVAKMTYLIWDIGNFDDVMARRLHQRNVEGKEERYLDPISPD
jgi:hypothetical protein